MGGEDLQRAAVGVAEEGETVARHAERVGRSQRLLAPTLAHGEDRLRRQRRPPREAEQSPLAAVAVGEEDDPRRQAAGDRLLEDAAGAENLVVGVGGEDQDAVAVGERERRRGGDGCGAGAGPLRRQRGAGGQPGGEDGGEGEAAGEERDAAARRAHPAA